MKRLFDLDSSLVLFLDELVDVVILNVICLICCIPIITIGPAVTAMHYVTIKMVRGETGYIAKAFFKSFRENFKKSFVVWMIFLLITAFFVIDYKILQAAGIEEHKTIAIIIASIYLFVCITVMYIFPILSCFENTLRQTIKNAFFMSILHFIRTILMAVIYMVPFMILQLGFNMIAVFLLLGLSGPAYINSFIWKGIFKKYMPEELEKEDDVLKQEEYE